MTPGATERVRAPAKLTLSLHVTGRRDDGLHTLDAEMTTLTVADVLDITPAEVISLEVISMRGSGRGSEWGPGGGEVPSGDTNLVVRALRAAGRTAAVRLHKRIPSEAGLGGGSADAAAVLRWAGTDDLGLAARLGADVPFCVIGGRARVTGIGERIEPLPPASTSVTLLTPPFGVSTAEVYAAWDRLGGPADEVNDLTTAALDVEPRLGEWRDALAAATDATPRLAGSGGTWFVIGAHHGVSHRGVPALVADTA